MKWLSVLLVASAVWVPGTGAAQEADPREAGLRERIAAEPGNTRASCELGALLVRRDAHEEARNILERAVHVLAARTGRRAHRSLGACLYNLGRAYEADGGDPYLVGLALDTYRWSLEVRANATVAARLAGLADLSAEISAADVTAPEPLSRGMIDS